MGVFAQEGVEFTADRPGASTGPSVLGHGVVQLEQGLQYEGDYGLFPAMELRLGGDASCISTLA